uniref:Uncharacterized protein n=1 Tax=Glossina pallidipes TaxID=7398 RepID=A0A1B0ADM6_GLOPL
MQQQYLYKERTEVRLSCYETSHNRSTNDSLSSLQEEHYIQSRTMIFIIKVIFVTLEALESILKQPHKSLRNNRIKVDYTYRIYTYTYPSVVTLPPALTCNYICVAFIKNHNGLSRVLVNVD